MTIEVVGPAGVVSALSSRLGSFRVDECGAATLKFRFHTTSSTEGHSIRKPNGPSRAFYAPAAGEALYFPENDFFYLDYEGRVRCLCSPGVGCCEVSVLEPERDQLWLATHPLFTLPLLEMMKRRARFNVHAACFARNGKALLLPGTSGAGKSTLTIALLLAGLDFLSDDMVFLRRTEELQVLAFAEGIDVSDNTVAFFDRLSFLKDQPKRTGWPKHEIQVCETFQSSIAWTARPKALVFPQIRYKVESQLTPISSDEAFLELAPNVLITEAVSTRAHFEILAQLVNEVPAYRLETGTDFDRASAMLGELIG
jgi:hypothetical protein